MYSSRAKIGSQNRLLRPRVSKEGGLGDVVSVEASDRLTICSLRRRSVKGIFFSKFVTVLQMT